jgi:hypothetical protein
MPTQQTRGQNDAGGGSRLGRCIEVHGIPTKGMSADERRVKRMIERGISSSGRLQTQEEDVRGMEEIKD